MAKNLSASLKKLGFRIERLGGNITGWVCSDGKTEAYIVEPEGGGTAPIRADASASIVTMPVGTSEPEQEFETALFVVVAGLHRLKADRTPLSEAVQYVAAEDRVGPHRNPGRNLRVGDVVALAARRYLEVGSIPAGAVGTIVLNDGDSLEIEMAAHWPVLDEWGNRLIFNFDQEGESEEELAELLRPVTLQDRG